MGEPYKQNHAGVLIDIPNQDVGKGTLSLGERTLEVNHSSLTGPDFVSYCERSANDWRFKVEEAERQYREARMADDILKSLEDRIGDSSIT